MDTLKNQPCPVCGKKKAVLMEEEIDVPYFGKTFVFSICCEDCGFSKADIEAVEDKEPVKITFETTSEEDMKVRIVKSSNALVKIPTLRMSIEPGEGSDGFISNVEGLIGKFEKVIEGQRDSSDDPSVRKSAKNLLKKIRKIKFGDLPMKIVIEDPSGNSAIISDKAEVSKMKKK
ncbi:ZPR1 zinc finger domain-containing protein [Candidatus Woesearchaeota archaeon]|jgi:zinc finger protein|nr:ZPR1 zinc finger domain-containing protein [Candidatus Woesearchaeota archaeon]MBT4322194.1 ZPR1 zinc finger domain-containing protein [Candidatus Woesearchaeota archaeon]MBT4631214.1 ZPR1 zinc finger domain-containing protein [Candidatus Woesearchaeota archaeon]